MDNRCINRMTVLGSKEQVQRFLKSKWERRLHARYCEWIENFPCRVVCLFETDDPPLESLSKLSRGWPQLTLMVDYEIERQRIKGLAKTQEGQTSHCEFGY